MCLYEGQGYKQTLKEAQGGKDLVWAWVLDDKREDKGVIEEVFTMGTK